MSLALLSFSSVMSTVGAVCLAILILLAMVTVHEFGHYIDSTAGQLESGCISSLDKINEVFQKEYEEFKKVATSEEEGFIDYFTGTIQGADRAAEERVAEANMLLHANPAEQLATRAYYFQRYFPRTIAIIAEEISKVEQQAITKE